LDSGNDTTRALREKRLTTSNCFFYDQFPRRVRTSDGMMNVREVCGEWNEVHDKLQSEYRKLGGKITLVLGAEAFKAYLCVAERENVTLQTLTENVPCGYTVLVERMRVLPLRTQSKIVGPI
jgi:hypothetical protein